MKKLLFLLIAVIGMGLINTIDAQTTQSKTITIDENDLPANVLAEIKLKQEQDALADKMEHYGKWVGVGNEVGTAIREGLMAVKDVAVEFGDTKIGEFTMVLIAWKVIGKDLLRIILGIVFIILTSLFISRTYRNTFKPKRILIEDPGLFKYPKKYKVIEPNNDYEGVTAVKIIFIVLQAGMFGFTYLIMFGNS